MSLGGYLELSQELRARVGAVRDRDGAVVLLDDAVGDGEAEPGPGPHVLGREEGIEDALLEPFRNAGAGVTHGHAHVAPVDRAANGDELTPRVRHGVTRVGQ